MIKLTDGKVFINDIAINIDKCNYAEGVAVLSLPDGGIMCLPEEDATPDELEVIQSIRAEVETRTPTPQDPPVVPEPVDEEKAAMAEAIIDMSMQIEELRAEIASLKGGA